MPIMGLIELIQANKKEGMAVAEIGVYDGDSTKAYAPIIKENHGIIYVIDWFNGNIDAGPGPHGYNEGVRENIRDQFEANMSDYLEYLAIHQGISWEVATEIADESLDICFIDADHRYESVKKDITAYLPKIKKGGIIAGHDCENFDGVNNFTEAQLKSDWDSVNSIHPGVIQAVYDNFGTDVNLVNEGAWKIWWKKLD